MALEKLSLSRRLLFKANKPVLKMCRRPADTVDVLSTFVDSNELTDTQRGSATISSMQSGLVVAGVRLGLQQILIMIQS